jgi:hypothetical protein
LAGPPQFVIAPECCKRKKGAAREIARPLGRTKTRLILWR